MSRPLRLVVLSRSHGCLFIASHALRWDRDGDGAQATFSGDDTRFHDGIDYTIRW